MLPKNRLREPRLERLKIFTGTETPYDANIIRDHADEFGKTFKRAREVEKQASEIAQAQVSA